MERHGDTDADPALAIARFAADGIWLTGGKATAADRLEGLLVGMTQPPGRPHTNQPTGKGKPMSACFIFDDIETHDQAAIDDYIRRAPATVAAFGGKYRAIFGKVMPVEGDYAPVRPIVIEFPDFEKARAWYESDMYRPLKALRTGARKSTGYMASLLRIRLADGVAMGHRV